MNIEYKNYETGGMAADGGLGTGGGAGVFVVGAITLAQNFEDVKAEFEAEDADCGLGVEPGGDEEGDRFGDLPELFAI